VGLALGFPSNVVPSKEGLMKRAACIILTAFSVLLLQGSAPAQAAAGPPASGSQGTRRPKYKPDELLVRFRTGASSEDMQTAHARVPAQVVKSYHIVSNLQLIHLPPGTNLLRAARAYRKDKSVLYAEPNYRVHTLTTPNDPQFTNGTQWDMDNTGQNGGTADADIDAPEAWSITTGDSSVVIGVIDTGVDYNHPDLTGNMHHLESDCSDGVDNDGNGHVDDCFGINAITGSSNPFDDHHHGTHVSGTIGAKGNNNLGVTGVNWNVGLVACKFLDADGFGFDSDAITCLEYFKDLKDNHGLNLVATNNSWGGGGFSQALSDAIDAHRQSGILFIAAAGNAASDNDGGQFLPADYFLPNVIAVAATDRNDNLADFSNFGKRTVHLGAPGVDILSTTPNDTYQTFSGTSMAAPHVTGVAALLKAQAGSRDWRAIKNLILAGGDNKASVANTITGKRLNANGALTCSNSTVLSRLRPTGDIPSAATGGTVLLAVLHINCAAPAGDVDVTINPGGTTVTLKDDGAAPDQAAGDGIYTAQFTAGAPGIYTVSITGGETFTLNVLETYFFQPVANSYRTIGDTNNLNFFDDDVAQITPSFPVAFGSGSFSSMFVSSNGTISFDNAFSDFFNTPLPAAGPQTLVAPFWTDLFEGNSSTQNVFWEESGSTPNRELVIEWRDVIQFSSCDSSETVRFQVVFFESKSDVLFNYADVVFGGCASFADLGSASTVGVQVAPTSSNQFSFNEPSLDDNKALLWTTTGPDVKNPLPSVTSLSPGSTSTVADFTLTVNGSNFVSDSVVRWNGSDRPTTFVNGGQLTAQISAADVSVVGTATVTVFTFAGGNSNPATFTVIGPVINSLTPASASAGGPGFTLTVDGSGFDSAAVVRWNGADRTTTFVNSGQLTAAITAADIAAPGQATVTVVNPGGVTSAGVTFAITAPVINSLTPASASAGGPGFTLTVDGSDFISGAVVRWNGADRTTTFANSGQLNAAITAADIAAPGQVTVTVVNPGGVTSAGVTFAITDFTLSVFPTSVTVSPGQSAAYTVTATAVGGGFDNSVALSCSLSSPVGTCSLSPPSGTPGAANFFTSTLTIQTSPSATLRSPFGSHPELPALAILFWMPLAAGFAVTPAGRHSRGKKIVFSSLLALLLVGMMLQAGCGGGGGGTSSSTPPPAPRTVTVTVTGTSGTLQHSTTTILVIR
jgi:subtilisin family serine protease